MVPSPTTLVYVESMDAVLSAARSRWFPLFAVTNRIEHWLEEAVGGMSSVGALVGCLRSHPIAVQVNPGLDWIRTLWPGVTAQR